MSERALVLFSGGQDSTVCLVWALERFDHVETVGFDYGQRHVAELDCRGAIRTRLSAAFPAWTARLGEDHLLALPTLGAATSYTILKHGNDLMQSATPAAMAIGLVLIPVYTFYLLLEQRKIERLVTAQRGLVEITIRTDGRIEKWSFKRADGE